MDDVAAFLRDHPPFDTLDDAGLAAVADAADPEEHRAGELILEHADATAEHVYVVRRGAVELRSDGRLLDVVGEGELFGFASILAESPLGFVARASEDTLVYRIAEDGDPAGAGAPGRAAVRRAVALGAAARAGRIPARRSPRPAARSPS